MSDDAGQDDWVDPDQKAPEPAGGADDWVSPPSAPVTASGVGEQLGRGAESGLYHAATAAVDLPVNAWNAAKDIYQGVTGTGPYSKTAPTPPPQPSPASNWLMGQAGKINPQLDPNNYPAQNWPERIARGAGDVGTQAMLGRGAGTAATALTEGTQALPSAVTIGKQLAGAGVGGAGGGAGAEVGRGSVSHLLDANPNFRRLHPGLSTALEDTGGVLGGMAGGAAGASVANRVGLPAGAPRTTQSPADLRAIATGQYTAAKNTPANYHAPAVAAWANNHLNNLVATYGSPQIGPIATQLAKIANPPPGALPVPLLQLTSLSDKLGNTVKAGTQPTGITPLASAAAETQRAIDGFIRNPPPGSIHSGDPAKAAALFNTADANWAASQRGQKLQNIQQDASLPGRPSTREQVTNLVRPTTINRQLRGFNDDEKQQLTDYAHGTKLGNMLSNFGGEGGHSGPLGALYPVVEGAKMGREWGRATEIPGAGFVGGAIGAAAYPTAKWGARALARKVQPQFSPIIEQTMSRAPDYEAPTPASPFRQAIPMGLGALSGLQSQ